LAKPPSYFCKFKKGLAYHIFYLLSKTEVRSKKSHKKDGNFEGLLTVFWPMLRRSLTPE